MSCYHLLSGNNFDTLMSPSKQGITILLIAGIVSLLIQYPINLLKGEATSTATEQRIRSSNCSVKSCRYVGYRLPWFDDATRTQEIWIPKLRDEGKQGRVIEANMKSACLTYSLSTIGMMSWTRLALLLQYHTICDEPDLMKLHMSRMRDESVFEALAKSRATQPVCSCGESNGGQVLLKKHLHVTSQILEHDLLKFPHLRLSLYPRDLNEYEFWDKSASKRVPFKAKINETMMRLRKMYLDLKMFDDRKKFTPLGLQHMGMILFTFLYIVFTVIVGSAAKTLVLHITGWCRSVFR